MEAIDASSRHIVDLIAHIAFQTNILALNAALRAAHAGEQGRAFAVLPSDVRNLAHRSAAAAKDIKCLIDASVDQMAAGSEQVRLAGAAVVGTFRLAADPVPAASAPRRPYQTAPARLALA